MLTPRGDKPNRSSLVSGALAHVAWEATVLVDAKPLILQRRILEVAIVLTHVFLDLVARPSLVHPRPGPWLGEELLIVDGHLVLHDLVVQQSHALGDAHVHRMRCIA